MTLTTLQIWLLTHHLPLCEAGLAPVYLTLAILYWPDLRRHAIAYAVAFLLVPCVIHGAGHCARVGGRRAPNMTLVERGIFNDGFH